MANFYAYDFEFDGMPSQMYDLKIISFDDGGLFNGAGSSDIDIISQRVLRKSKPYYLGRIQNRVLEFTLTFGRAQPISAIERSAISKWLFGRANYKKLIILQDDLLGAYFNCFLTNPEPIYIGGVNYAFQVKVTCDSPFAYRDKTILFRSQMPGLSNKTTITFDNNSAEEAYIYPVLTYTLYDGANTINFRKFHSVDGSNSVPGDYLDTRFGNLEANSSGTINNDTQVLDIVPLTGTMLQCFSSKNWLKLTPGTNKVTIDAAAGGTWGKQFEATIEFQERLKVGG